MRLKDVLRVSDMRILHILSSGDIGGIEVLCKDIGQISRHENYFLFVWRGGVIEDEMRRSGLNTAICGVKGKVSLKAVNTILKMCEEKQIQCIVVHHPSPLLWLYVPLIKFRRKDIRIFMYAHNNAANMLEKYNSKKYCIYKKMLAWAYKSADGIIAISESVKQSIMDEYPYIRSEFIHVVYNGIKINNFKVSHRNENDLIRILYVGRIKKEKGVHLIVEAIEKLPKDVPAFECIIAGEGPYFSELRKSIVEKGLENKIKAIGPIRDVPALLETGDIFIHPSVWKEGFGISIAEAMAAGLVCIGSDRGAIPELIRNQNNGFICSVEDASNLTAVLKQVMLSIDSVAMKKIRTNAVENSKRFCIENTVSALDSLFEN